jgi:flagella basal body P-ring formation protein FlgA
MRTRIAIVLALLAGPAACARAQEAPARDAVVITLQPEVMIDSTIVYLGQIASLRGGNVALQRRLAMLDVADFSLSADKTFVSAEQVKFRLLLAGVESSQFVLAGARRTTVTEPDEPIAMRAILASVETALKQQHPGQEFHDAMIPTRAVELPDINLRPGELVQYTTRITKSGPRPGSVRADVAIVVAGRTRGTVPIHLELPGLERQARKGSRDVGVVQAANVAPAPDADFVVRQRDNVKIIAPVGAGPIRVEATGEALQDGKIGDIIRVRNCASSNIIPGRVQGPGLVIAE